MAPRMKDLHKLLGRAHSLGNALPVLSKLTSNLRLNAEATPRSQLLECSSQHHLLKHANTNCPNSQPTGPFQRIGMPYWSAYLGIAWRCYTMPIAQPVLHKLLTATEFSSQAGTAAVKSSSNLVSEANESPSAPPLATGSSARFYKVASAQAAEDGGGGWVVKLDRHILRTPAKRVLRLPTRELAMAIAAEWDWQDDNAIRPFTMPLMKLAATSIDQIPVDRERVVMHLLKYFHTDSLCIRAPEPSLLADKQAEMWDPVLTWIEGELGGVRPFATSSLLGEEQPAATMAAMEVLLRSLNDFELAAVDSLAGSARSLIAAFAVARGRLSPAEAIPVVRLEEDFQAEEWGFVEGGHDIDIADMQVRMVAPSVFLRLVATKS